jgi:hypothetical protein
VPQPLAEHHQQQQQVLFRQPLADVTHPLKPSLAAAAAAAAAAKSSVTRAAPTVQHASQSARLQELSGRAAAGP